MKYNFAQQGVCSTNVEFELDGDIVRNVSFSGGCNGNLKALSALVEGMTVKQVTERLRGDNMRVQEDFMFRPVRPGAGKGGR